MDDLKNTECRGAHCAPVHRRQNKNRLPCPGAREAAVNRGSTLISHSVAGDGSLTGGHPHPARSRMHFMRGFPRTAPSLWQFLSDGPHSHYFTSFYAIFGLHASILPRAGFGVKRQGRSNLEKPPASRKSIFSLRSISNRAIVGAHIVRPPNYHRIPYIAGVQCAPLHAIFDTLSQGRGKIDFPAPASS